jgi:hypothetical protein
VEPPPVTGAAEPTAPVQDEVPEGEPLSLPTTIAALAVIVAGAAVAWAVPITSVVLVWPILFFVPGWVVIRRVAPDLPLPGTVGAAVVSSV